MASYVLTIVGYPASDSTGTFEWGSAGAHGLLAAGRGTITGSGTAASLAVERLTYHALLAGLQALLAEDDAGALTIAAAPAFIALLRPGNHPEEPILQRLREHAVQLHNQVRDELTLYARMVVPPLFVEATELARPAAKPLPPRVIAFVTQLNANPGAVTDEDGGFCISPQKGALADFGGCFLWRRAGFTEIAIDRRFCDPVVAHQSPNEHPLPAPILQFRNLLPR